MKKYYLLAMALTMLALSQAYGQHNTYYIGHSGFGWDLIVGDMVEDLADDAGINSYDYGYQFTGGTCISTQWLEHDQRQGGTDSRIELATGNYDIVILAEQIPLEEVIYSSQWGCDLTSVQSVDSFFDLSTNANPNTKLYLMEFHNEINLNNADPYGEWVALNQEMRPLWEQVADSVGSINNNANVYIVPVAEAFQRLVDTVRAGNYPGTNNWVDLFDANDLPEATIHPSEETYYLVACVHYATIFGQSPQGLTNETFAQMRWGFDPPTPAQAAIMQRIAWDVVSADAYTGLNSTTHVSVPKQIDVAVQYESNLIRLRYAADAFDAAAVFNMGGQKVYESTTSNGVFEWRTSDFNHGVYFVELMGAVGNTSYKVIVQ